MNTSTLRTVALLFAIAALSFVAPGSLWAASLTFDDTAPPPNETITVSADGFEGGLALNGIPFQIGLGSPATTVPPLPETGPISFTGTWITSGLPGPVGETIFLVESPFDPAGPPPLISDILQFQIIPNTDGQTARIDGSFVSDINDNLGTVPAGVSPNNVFLETATGVTLPFFGLNINLISDINVPEPATFGLLAGGLFGLACLGWRRQRTRQA
jgi:hypothetical protein